MCLCTHKSCLDPRDPQAKCIGARACPGGLSQQRIWPPANLVQFCRVWCAAVVPVSNRKRPRTKRQRAQPVYLPNREGGSSHLFLIGYFQTWKRNRRSLSSLLITFSLAPPGFTGRGGYGKVQADRSALAISWSRREAG